MSQNALVHAFVHTHMCVLCVPQENRKATQICTTRLSQALFACMSLHRIQAPMPHQLMESRFLGGRLIYRGLHLAEVVSSLIRATICYLCAQTYHQPWLPHCGLGRMCRLTS